MATRSPSYSPIKEWHDRELKFDTRGYILVMVPEHPKSFRGGWYYEHRLVSERSIGRVLFSDETCHHLNEDKFDNREINLFVCTRKEHNKAHALTAA